MEQESETELHLVWFFM